MTLRDRGAVVVAVAVPLTFLAVFFAWPVAAILGRGLVVDGRLDLGGFGAVLGRSQTWQLVLRTLGQSVLATTLAVVLGVPGAHVLYRCRFRGRALVRVLVAVPFVMPTVVVGVAFRGLLVEGGPLGSLGLDQSFPALVAALVFFNYCVVVRTVGALWAHLDPRPEQAARALGASPAQAFREVTLPQLAPAIGSAAALVFLFSATAFGTVLVLAPPGYETVETEIYRQTVYFLDLRTAAVLSVLQVAMVAGVLVALAAARRRREQALRLQVDGSVDRPLRRVDLPAALVTGCVVVGLVLLPLVSLLSGALRVGDGWGLANFDALSRPLSQVGLEVSAWQATLNSLRIAVDATAIAVGLGVLVSLLLSRRPRSRPLRSARSVFDGVFMLPLGVSAVTVGFGFVVTLNRPPLDLSTSIILVPIAQAVVALPLVIRTLLPVLRAIDTRTREAAAVLGASPARVLSEVDLPVLGRSLGVAVGLAYAVSLGEFGATSFLARPDQPTLPVVVVRLISRPGENNLGMALAAAVVLAGLIMAVMAAAERLRTDTWGADV
jgi:thiamine transport system permease protein